MKYMYRDQRGVPFLLPFLAGAVVGPLFFNGIQGYGCGRQGCGNVPVSYQQFYYPQPIYQQPIYQQQFYPYM